MAHRSHLNTRDCGEGKTPFAAFATAIACSQIGQIEIRESVFTAQPQTKPKIGSA
jgi:hypothetical protein